MAAVLVSSWPAQSVLLATVAVGLWTIGLVLYAAAFLVRLARPREPASGG